jgi:hypothetical protein
LPALKDVMKSVLAIDEINSGLGGLRLREQPPTSPFGKDYDACPEGGPLNWFPAGRLHFRGRG